MNINAALVVRLRKRRSWSQDELAIASGLNLRTIQRIEKYALASLQSKKAVAAALDIDTQDLDNEDTEMKHDNGSEMKPCPVCGSNEIYQYKEYFHGPGASDGDDLLPKLGGTFATAKVRTTACYGCGHVRIFASEDARRKLKTSKHWKRV